MYWDLYLNLSRWSLTLSRRTNFVLSVIVKEVTKVPGFLTRLPQGTPSFFFQWTLSIINPVTQKALRMEKVLHFLPLSRWFDRVLFTIDTERFYKFCDFKKRCKRAGFAAVANLGCWALPLKAFWQWWTALLQRYRKFPNHNLHCNMAAEKLRKE